LASELTFVGRQGSTTEEELHMLRVQCCAMDTIKHVQFYLAFLGTICFEGGRRGEGGPNNVYTWVNVKIIN
jgi:hypothetical protein